MQEIKVQGPFCKRCCNVGVQLQFGPRVRLKQMLKLRGPNWKTTTLVQKWRRFFISIYRLLLLETEESPCKGKGRLPQTTHKRKAIPTTSITVFPGHLPRDAIGGVKKATTNSPIVAGLLESETQQDTNTPASFILLPRRKRRAGRLPHKPLFKDESVFGKTSRLFNIFYFSFILKSGWTSPFLILENSEIYGDLRVFICGPLVLCFIFFSFVFCLFFSAIYSICGPLLLNANMLFNAFFFIVV